MSSAVVDTIRPNLATSTVDPVGERMREVLARQRAAMLADGPPSAELRIDRIDRAIALLLTHRDALCDAIAADYIVRSPKQTLMVDVATSIDGLKHARKHLRGWMKPERRQPNFPLGLLGARTHVEFQPCGIVANIVPWNFPIYLAFGPMAGIFAAGNRCMTKMSELVPETAALVQELVAASFDESEFAVFCGDAEVGAAFAALPFNHLFFTGSPRVGKLVMRAAAENLTPVTLELGGKSPVIVDASADLGRVAHRVAWGKLLNAGQACLAPDYVMLPAGRIDEFIAEFRGAVAKMYPTLLNNPEYPSLASTIQQRRLNTTLVDARARGIRLVEINPAGEDFDAQTTRKMVPTIWWIRTMTASRCRTRSSARCCR